jgi:hypothetical protein
MQQAAFFAELLSSPSPSTSCQEVQRAVPLRTNAHVAPASAPEVQSFLMARRLKTEHAGGKNGGGSYGKREEVKRASRHARRAAGRRVVAVQRAQAGE